jgi:DNA polymerase/3'-5' exonuclease PolX
LRQTKNSLSIIKKYPKTINNDTIDDFKELPGIGRGTIDRIKEILSTNKLKETKDFKEDKTMKEHNKALEDLESVVGIGRSHAIELIKQGITSVMKLKKAIDNNSIRVNEKIALGVKYHKVFEGNIPRAEITKVYKLLKKVIDKLNKQFNKQFIFEICGSYRREKQTSGDIDVLISKKTINQNDNDNDLEKIIKSLKDPLKTNDNKPFLIDDMTDNYKTKYMGFSQYKKNKVRRIDIRFVPYESYFSALLYFTGPAELNKTMRTEAKKKDLKLSEYGLTKKDGTRIPINSEYDVFKILS